MSQLIVRKIRPLWIGIVIIFSGCDERVARISREAADRQAEQNRVMARLQQDVADGARGLIEADAAARHDFMAVYRHLQSGHQGLDRARTDLETERRAIAQDRRSESLLVSLAPLVSGSLLLAILVAFLRHVLERATATDVVDAELNNLLIDELIEPSSTRRDIEHGARDAPPIPELPAEIEQ